MYGLHVLLWDYVVCKSSTIAFPDNAALSDEFLVRIHEPLRTRVGHPAFLKKMSWRCYKVGTLLKFLVTQWANPNPLYAEDMARIHLWLSIMVNEFVSQNGPSPSHPRISR